MFYPQIINFNKLSHETNPPAIGIPPGLSQLPGILHDCSGRVRPGLGTNVRNPKRLMVIWSIFWLVVKPPSWKMGKSVIEAGLNKHTHTHIYIYIHNYIYIYHYISLYIIIYYIIYHYISDQFCVHRPTAIKLHEPWAWQLKSFVFADRKLCWWCTAGWASEELVHQ